MLSDLSVAKNDGADPTVSIIIASYNAQAMLADCLESIYQNRPKASFEVIVVDDASEDGTDEMVQRSFPQVRLLRNETNIHYASSNNRAIQCARGEYIYLVNNDSVMLPDTIDRLIAFLREHPDAGVVGSKLLNEDGTVQWSVKLLPNPLSALFGARSIITQWFPNNPFSRQHLLHLSRDMTQPLDSGYVSSASMMLPRRVIDQVGALDVRLSYHVDADYCKRISNAGWEIYYLPSATAIHLNHKGGTLVNWKRRFRSLVEFHWGSYIYYRKHLMKSPFNLMHVAVIAGLGGRFLISVALQAVSELITDAGQRPEPQKPTSR